MTKLEYVQARIQLLREFLLTTLPIVTVNISGESVQIDRAGAVEELKELERQEQDLLHPNRRRRHIDLSGAF